MRMSVILLVVSLLGVLAGGWLIGRWAFGLCVIADSAALFVWALLRDDGKAEPEPQVQSVSSLHDILERARRAG